MLDAIEEGRINTPVFVRARDHSPRAARRVKFPRFRTCALRHAPHRARHEHNPRRLCLFEYSATRAERIARLDALASLLDTAILIPGTNVRFGLDALIGLVPGVGDVVTTFLSLCIVKEARALGAPRHLILRMLGNVALDSVVGVVPWPATCST